MPSTSPPTTSSPTLCGTSQHSRRADSSFARPWTHAAATRARSASNAVTVAEADEDPALALGVGDRERAELRLRLAGVDERLQRPVLDVVRHALAVKRPMTMVSAPVSLGESVVAVTFTLSASPYRQAAGDEDPVPARAATRCDVLARDGPDVEPAAVARARRARSTRSGARSAAAAHDRDPQPPGARPAPS